MQRLDSDVSIVADASSEELPPQPTSHSSDLLFEYVIGSETSIFGACQILLNTVVGSGALMIPYCFGAGLGLALIVSFVFAALSYLSIHFLIEAGYAVHVCDYNGLFDHCFTKQRHWILDVLISCLTYGTLMIYAHWNGRLVNQVVSNFIGNVPILTNDAFWIFFISAVVVYPLTFFQTIGKLGVISFFSTFFVFMLTVHASYQLILDVHDRFTYHPKDIKYFAFHRWHVLVTSFSVISLAFICHLNLFPVFASVYNCTIGKARLIGVIVCAGAYVLYNAFGLVTYVDKPTELLEQPTALMLYYPTRNAFTILATLGVVVLIIGSVPVVFWPLRISLNHMIFKDKPMTPLRWVVISGIVIFSSTLIASLSNDVVVFFNIVGGIFTPIIAFLFPAWFFLKCVTERSGIMTYLAYQQLVVAVIVIAMSIYQSYDSAAHPAG